MGPRITGSEGREEGERKSQEVGDKWGCLGVGGNHLHPSLSVPLPQTTHAYRI